MKRSKTHLVGRGKVAVGVGLNARDFWLLFIDRKSNNKIS